MARTLTPTERTLLQAAHLNVYVKFEVQNPDLSWVDLSTGLGATDWFTDVKLTETLDANSATMTATILRDLGAGSPTLSLAPLRTDSALNRAAGGGYAPFLDVRRQWRASQAVTAHGVAPVAGDWKQLGIGYVDSIDVPGNGAVITITGRDLGAKLLDTFISVKRPYGSSDFGGAIPGTGAYGSFSRTAGTWTENAEIGKVAAFYSAAGALIGPFTVTSNGPTVLIFTGDATGATSLGNMSMEVCIQKMLDDNLGAGAVTLYTPTSPSFVITPVFTQDNASLMQAINDVAALAGFVCKYRYDAADVSRLTLYQANRGATVADWSLGPSEYLAVPLNRLDITGVRNDIAVKYRDATTETVATVTSTNAASITRFGDRYMAIDLGGGSPVNSAARAQALADAVVADLCLPNLEQRFEALAFWPVQLGDYGQFLANAVQYDSDQYGGVTAITHTMQAGSVRTVIDVRGKPAGRYALWLGMGAGVPTLEYSECLPTVTAVSAAQVTVTVTAATTALGTSQVELIAVTGSASRASGPLPGVLSPSGTVWVFNRGAFQSGLGQAQFRAILAGTQDDDAFTEIAEQGRDTIPLLCRAKVQSASGTQVVARVAVADPIAQTGQDVTLTYVATGCSINTPASPQTILSANITTDIDTTGTVDVTIGRAAFGGGTGRVTFTATRANRTTDSDALDVPSLDRDTISLVARARVTSTSSTQVVVRVAVADPYPQGAGSATITYQDLGSGGVTPLGDQTVTPDATITESLGPPPTYIDYTITRAAAGSGTARVTFTAAAANRQSAVDAVDVPSQNSTLGGLGGEPALGNPAADNYVLQSTAAGARSWVAKPASLSAVENAALSTWAGTTNLTTVGTIVTGVWHGTAIADTYISSAATWTAKQAAYTNLTTIGALANAAGWLHDNGAGVFAYSTPSKGDVGLGNVENTALSTWPGSPNLVTAGALAVASLTSSGALSGTVATLNPGTTPGDAVVLDIAALAVAGTRDSHNLRWAGHAFDTVTHQADWRGYVNVTSNAGASTWRLQSRVDAGAFADRLSLSDAGVLSVAGSYQIGGTSVLTATTLGAGVVNSSLANTSAASFSFNGGAGAVAMGALTATTVTTGGGPNAIFINNSETGVNQIRLGANYGASLGTRYSGGDVMLSTNAYQTAASTDNWHQQSSLFASTQLWLGLTSGNTKIRHAPASRADAADASFWTDILMLSPAGALTLAAGLTATTGLFSGAVELQSTLKVGGLTYTWPATRAASTVLTENGMGGLSWAAGAALTKTDDTNVTLTLGGAPASALLAATSLTLGWTGRLALSRFATGTNGYALVGTGATDAAYRQLTAADIAAGTFPGAAYTVTGTLAVSDVTDATSATAASLKTAGGLATAKDIWVGSLGRFDSTGAATADQLLWYNATVSKWQPHTVRLGVNSGVAFGTSLGDGTTAAYFNSHPTLAGTPAAPTAAPLTTIYYHAIAVDMGARVLAAGEQYVLDYSTNGAAYTSGAIVGTSPRVVHSNLDPAKTYAYKYLVRGATDSAYSTATGALTPTAYTDNAAFGLIAASQIAVQNLAALAADIGILSAGRIDNAASSPTAGVLVSSGYSLPTTWRTYLDLTVGLFTVKDNQGSPTTRVQVGKVGAGTTDYGLQVYDAAGATVMDFTSAKRIFAVPVQDQGAQSSGFSTDLTTGLTQRVQLGANALAQTFTGMINGGRYRMWYQQDTVGGRTMPVPNATVMWAADAAPTLSTEPGAYDIVEYEYSTVPLGRFSAVVLARNVKLPSPSFSSYTPSAFGTASMIHNVQMPATVAAGDLLVVVFANDSSATTTPSGWSKVGNGSANSGNSAVYVFAKVAAGTEGGTTVNCATALASLAAAHVYRVVGKWRGALAGVTAAFTTGVASGTLTGATLAVSPADRYFLLAVGMITAQATALAYPTVSAPGVNYTGGQALQSGGAGGVTLASIRRNGYVASETPSNYTMNPSSDWVTATIAVQPPA